MKILVVGPAWVGDMVIAHALVRTLLARDPAVVVHMLCPPTTAPLAQRMSGVGACRVVPVRSGQWAWRPRRILAQQLRGDGYTQAIVLPNSFKSALVPYFAAIPRRTGWRGEWRYGLLNDLRHLDTGRFPRLLDRFVALAADAGAEPANGALLPQLTADTQRAASLVENLKLVHGGGVLALCPGAEYGPAKRWPGAYYASVAAAHLQKGEPVWLFGSAGDAGICAEIIAAVPETLRRLLFDLSGHTTLLDAVDLLSLTHQVITNDSGLMHVACALGLPVVAVFGSTSPTFTPPLSARARIVRDELPCSPCFRRSCPLGHTNCLNGLKPERVLAELK